MCDEGYSLDSEEPTARLMRTGQFVLDSPETVISHFAKFKAVCKDPLNLIVGYSVFRNLEPALTEEAPNVCRKLKGLDITVILADPQEHPDFPSEQWILQTTNFPHPLTLQVGYIYSTEKAE